MFLLSIKRSHKTLKSDNRLNKKEFHESKQTINLHLVNVDQLVISDKCKGSDDDLKSFIGYEEGEIVKHLRIIPLQMSRYLKTYLL